MKNFFKILTKESIVNLLHPFQTFILGQKILPRKLQKKIKHSISFYGENEAEHGNPISDNNSSLRDNSYYAYKNFKDLRLGGLKIKELMNIYNFKSKDFDDILPLKVDQLKNFPLEVHYLGYYLKWIPQEAFFIIQLKIVDLNPVHLEPKERIVNIIV